MSIDLLKKEGLSIYPEYITEKLENIIIECINKSSSSKGGKKRNSIQRYGSNIPYSGKIVSKVIPEWLDELSFFLVKNGLLDKKPDSVSINEYFPGQMIDYHIDSKGSGDVITVLSLQGNAVMGFRKNNNIIKINIPPRSLIQLRGSIRNDWEHAIDPVESKRYSIVFRCSKNDKNDRNRINKQRA